MAVDLESSLHNGRIDDKSDDMLSMKDSEDQLSLVLILHAKAICDLHLDSLVTIQSLYLHLLHHLSQIYT